MEVQFSGIDPASTDRRQSQATGAGPALQRRISDLLETNQSADNPREGGSTRVSVSAAARARLAEEESTGVREQQSEASEEQGPVAKLLEIQKERVASASEDNALPPPSTRPETEDRGSIRAAEQRLASAGLTV